MANGAPITPTAQPTDVMSQIDSLKNSQIAASTASLGAARDSSLSNIGVEQAKIAPQYYTSRNTAATQSDLGAKNFGGVSCAERTVQLRTSRAITDK